MFSDEALGRSFNFWQLLLSNLRGVGTCQHCGGEENDPRPRLLHVRKSPGLQGLT